MNSARALARRIRDRLNPPPSRPKTWQISQDYELHHAIVFMQGEPFQSAILSGGPFGEFIFDEFFSGENRLFEDFRAATAGKTGVDIGPCVWSPLVNWDFLSRRILIEPLGEKTMAFQRQNFGKSFFDGLDLRSHGADVFVPELEGAVDGVIYCRNMLDHTPNWPVVLSNIGLYAAPGCHLLFWSDYNHRGQADDGHYDICGSAEEMRRMIRSLGFGIDREFCDETRPEANWGCVARKIATVS